MMIDKYAHHQELLIHALHSASLDVSYIKSKVIVTPCKVVT